MTAAAARASRSMSFAASRQENETMSSCTATSVRLLGIAVSRRRGEDAHPDHANLKGGDPEYCSRGSA
ncbi:hypothetical protein GCM10012289_68620 [Nonomuraea cavernae]|uniref:Uncharacterized protein n=1 Tax=Nonomuraea cavernae TaxID=2045107 RepID=A0A918DSB8_9ACTN|nr:hypothetical protein GCM10012289_68620 [Nonomuraea cavernae]